MISLRKKILLLCTVACFVFGMIGCGKVITEKVDQEIEKPAESTKESAHETEK